MKMIHKQLMNTMKQELIIRGYSKQTIKTYEFYNNAFLKLIAKSPREVTRQDIQWYMRHLIEKGYERATINLAANSLKFYYNQILKRTFEVKRMRPEKKLHPVLSIDETIRLFDSALNEKHKMILNFFYYTGVRLSELRNIKVSDIDFERGQIHVRNGKGRKDRLITINNNLIGLLKEYIKTKTYEDYLFTTKKGKYSERTLQKICNNYAIKAGIRKKVTPHTLRRTFATHMIENKVDIYRVSRLMGHSQVATTEGYIDYARISLATD